MKRMRTLAVGAIAVAALAASILPATADQPVVTHSRAHSCALPDPDSASCNAIRVDTFVNGVLVSPDAAPAGYVYHNAAQLRTAYGVTSTGSPSTVIAIVDAHDAKSALTDLNIYRAGNGLPSIDNCAVDSSKKPIFDGVTACFAKVNQRGTTNGMPGPNTGWAQEISLDLDMASAICPQCSILLVEANTASFKNLNAAVSTAASFQSQGVKAISNSYGGGDVSGNSYPAYNDAANQGIAVTASTGDAGFGVSAPASFTNVIAVGGTSLTLDPITNAWASETVWPGAGSGCSTLNAKPSWQTTATSCPGKANADVAAVADPYTGVLAVWNGSWYIFGGTSVGSPIIAALYALAGGFSPVTTAAQLTWSSYNYSSNLHDVQSGANGPCTPILWCTAGPGWDGPTGLGTPNGLGAF